MLSNSSPKNTNMSNALVSAEACLNFLSEDQKKELLDSKTIIEFQAGESIIKEGFVASNIMYIESGLARLDVLNGKENSTVSLLTDKSFIGIICTFASRNLSFSAVALEKTTISIFDIEIFEKFIKQNGEFAYNLIRHMSAMTSEIVHHMSKFSNKNIDGALSILLCDFSKIYKSTSFTLPLNRKDIAKVIGYSKESVINTLSKFNKEGILKVKDKQIDILEFEKLKKISEIA
jgi:CRP-like cAMP-binding protein